MKKESKQTSSTTTNGLNRIYVSFSRKRFIWKKRKMNEYETTKTFPIQLKKPIDQIMVLLATNPHTHIHTLANEIYSELNG